MYKHQVGEIRRADTDFRRSGFPEQDKIAVRPDAVEQVIVHERPESHRTEARCEIEHDMRVRLHHHLQFVLRQRLYASKKSRLCLHGILPGECTTATVSLQRKVTGFFCVGNRVIRYAPLY